MSRQILVTLIFSALVWSTQTANILTILTIPAHSHFALVFRIAKELADRGHQVTFINPYPQKTPLKNYKDVSLADSVEYAEELKKGLMSRTKMSHSGNMHFLYDFTSELTKRMYKNENVQKLLRSNATFDLVIVAHFLNEAEIGFGYHFNAPVVLLGSQAANLLNNHIFSNPAPASYVPNMLTPFTKTMNFWERLQNLLMNALTDFMREWYQLPVQRQIFKNFITTDVELDDVVRNVSLLFTNSHVSFSDPVPHVPSIIEIGGYHVNPPQKLPEHLQKFLDEAQEGVILFSMGSNLKSKDLKAETREVLLKAFGKIKQKVLWKFEESLENLPENVHIMKWLPQQDVLAHPNIQAFITHGGRLSTIEAIYFGVPVIGIPVFGDQESNIASAVTGGYAVTVRLNQITEENLSWALNEILNNPKYRENVKQRSKLLHDQPLKPIESAIYWIEHVIKHRGAPHLRSVDPNLKWYQIHMIDVYAFFVTVITVLFFTVYIIVKQIAKLFKPKLKVAKSKKNK